MPQCELCTRSATHTTDKWYRFEDDFRRYTALCEPHWELYLSGLAGKSVTAAEISAAGPTRSAKAA